LRPPSVGNPTDSGPTGGICVLEGLHIGMPAHMASSPLPLSRAVGRTIVLLVDHDNEAQAMYAYGLSALGFDVMTAADADEAHARASARRPDIILATVAVDGGHDWALLGDLSADPETHNIPVVVVTMDASALVRARAEREGCAALCLKSCPPGELAVGLRALVNLGQLQKR
jgi:CheY-like chemotaxis protein